MTQPPPEQSPQQPQGPLPPQGAFGPPPQGSFGPPQQGQTPGFGPPLAPPPSGFGPHQVYRPTPAPAPPPGSGGRRPGRRTRGFKDACTEVTAFDVDTGDKLWTRSITIGYEKKKTEFDQVTVSGDTVAVGGLYGGAAFDLRSGEVRWEPKQGEKCRDVGYGGGERLVAVRSCGDYGSQRFQVQLLDPATGKSKWTHKLPAGVRSPSLVSTKPVVVALDSGEITSSGATDVFPLDDKGNRRTRIALTDGKYLHECGTVSVVQDCRAIAAGNGKLYVATEKREGVKEFSQTNDIVVFSLATGRTTGEKVEGGDSSPIFPIRMDGGNVLVYKSGPNAQVVSLDGRDLKKETVLLDAGTRPTALPPLITELRYHDNKLFLSSDLLGQYSEDKKTIMMFGFAAK